MRLGSGLHALTLTPEENSPWYPLNKRLDGLRSQFNAFKKDIYFLPLLGIEPQFLGHKTHSLPTTLTMQKYMQVLNVIHTSNFGFPSSDKVL